MTTSKRKTKTPAAYARERERAMMAAMRLVTALHDIGIVSLMIESVSVFPDKHYWAMVLVDRDEIPADTLHEIMGIAAQQGAIVSIKEVRLNQQSASRLTLWPAKD